MSARNPRNGRGNWQGNRQSHGQGNGRDASQGQVEHIKRLLTDHELYMGAFDRLWKTLRLHEQDILRPGDASRMTSFDAGQALRWIIGKYGDVEQSPVGVYRIKENKRWRFFAIREFEPEDKPGQKIRYAKELVPLRDTQANRVSGDGQAVRYDEVPAKGWEWTLRLTDLMELEDVIALSIRVGNCVACHHALFVEESQLRKIGPVCEGRQREALAAREAAKARALVLNTDAEAGA